MGDVIQIRDFETRQAVSKNLENERKKRDAEMEQMGREILAYAFGQCADTKPVVPDTAPAEYVAPDDDCA